MTESERLKAAVKKATEIYKPLYASGAISYYSWDYDPEFIISIQHGVSEDTDRHRFKTINDLEEWVDSFSSKGNREILHRKFSGVLK